MASLGDQGVLFGSSSTTDTWQWDGAKWTQKATTGPSAREYSAAAALSGKLVLFGGEANGTGAYLGDTWEWDGSVWTQRSVVGPSVRRGHAMVTF
jgi:hypothetical protein